MEEICKKSDVLEGSMKGFTVKGKQILIANVNSNFYATSAVCTHFKGYLPGGILKKNIIVCPVHGAQFDVTSGKVVKNVPGFIKILTGKGASDLQSFKVTIKDEKIFVDV